MARWTWEETILLKEVYNTMAVSDVKDKYFPHRSVKALKNKVYNLRIAGWRFKDAGKKSS